MVYSTEIASRTSTCTHCEINALLCSQAYVNCVSERARIGLCASSFVSRVAFAHTFPFDPRATRVHVGGKEEKRKSVCSRHSLKGIGFVGGVLNKWLRSYRRGKTWVKVAARFARFAYHRRRRRVFSALLRLRAETEGCRTKKVYGLQSTPGESVGGTIISNFPAFISRFAFLGETRDRKYPRVDVRSR